MNDMSLKTSAQISYFLSGTEAITFTPTCAAECYRWITAILTRFNYHQLSKHEKGSVQAYLQKMTNYSRQQLTRLISCHRKTGCVSRKDYQRQSFLSYYTRADVLLLAQTDEWHNTLSGPATKKLCERAFNIYKQLEYERLAEISIAHLYNLRHSNVYKKHRHHFTKTHRVASCIGQRRKPQPNGKPGFLRIDTVHQGDENKCKGVYHINVVDEVTQWEIVCTVEKISEAYLMPAVEFLLNAFPFTIIEFHSDNGSEYINKVVAQLLQKLFVEFTKSRARRTNDNALIEGKNGAVVRKHFGYIHIPQKWAPLINQFNQAHLNPYLNFHRPCFFPTVKTDAKGKQKKIYRYEDMMTPCDKLKSLPNAEQYLKPDITLDQLDNIVSAMSDNKAAKQMSEAKRQLFKTIFEQVKSLSPLTTTG